MARLLQTLLLFLLALPATAQLAQRVRGTITDAESGRPIPGATVSLFSNSAAETSTDSAGHFVLPDVPTGRQTFLVTAPGFEAATLPDIVVTSGKEPELTVRLKESLAGKLGEVTVRSGRAGKPLNEFATVSARSFSPEETRRYPAAFADPGRMAMNFPGVAPSFDGDNSIVVRGNSPRGILWRLEGIEIPNPNHFNDQGGSGGPVSMLNAATLGQSDFYTGAFAPEIGNALSGAFDLNFRNGNTERREHAVQIGVMGLEAAIEGPFKKGGKASYLFNYRYSTVALLERFTGLEGILPLYQDAALKLHLPTKKWGTFSVFGLGGLNVATRSIEADSTKWKDWTENYEYEERGRTGVAGISHQYFLGKDAYLKTVVSASHYGSAGTSDTLNVLDEYRRVQVDRTHFGNSALRASVLYNQKMNARHTLRAGVVAQQLGYGYTFDYYDGSERVWKSVLGDTGSTQYYQAFAQWKARVGAKLTLVGGAHASYYALSEKASIEPRVAAAYAINTVQKVSVAAGLHTKPLDAATHLYQTPAAKAAGIFPNKSLDLERAAHLVAGYERILPLGMRLKVEAYYQHLYDVAVEQGAANGFSLINSDGIYALLATERPLVSTGTGANRGVDVSIERPISKGWYFTASGSVFRSTFTDGSGTEYRSRYDRGYNANAVGGKEFNVARSSVLGVNGRLLAAGAMRESPIDLEASRAAGRTVFVPGKYFSQRGQDYFRADASVYYRINRRASTHTVSLDVQNVMNRPNYLASYYDNRSGEIRRENQLGILPNISYRVEFR